MLGGGGAQGLRVAGRLFSSGSGLEAVVDLPTNESIESGDMLLVMLALDGTSISNWDITKDFTEILALDNSQLNLAIAYRIADGTEGSSVTFDHPGSSDKAHIAYHIKGNSSSAPQITNDNRDGTDPNPPNLTPSWGSKSTLWIAGTANEQVATTGDPTNYINGLGGSLTRFIRCAERLLVATSENPGVFTATIDDHIAFTIAIEPAV